MCTLGLSEYFGSWPGVRQRDQAAGAQGELTEGAGISHASGQLCDRRRPACRSEGPCGTAGLSPGHTLRGRLGGQGCLLLTGGWQIRRSVCGRVHSPSPGQVKGRWPWLLGVCSGSSDFRGNSSRNCDLPQLLSPGVCLLCHLPVLIAPLQRQAGSFPHLPPCYSALPGAESLSSYWGHRRRHTARQAHGPQPPRNLNPLSQRLPRPKCGRHL